MRKFNTGATRDTEAGKYDYEGFLSPLVLERYAQYMHKHRQQADGSLRDSDNWQKGIPFSAYMKSMWRHFMDMWKGHRAEAVAAEAFEDAICGILFNASGYLHELLKQKKVSRDARFLSSLGRRKSLVLSEDEIEKLREFSAREIASMRSKEGK